MKSFFSSLFTGEGAKMIGKPDPGTCTQQHATMKSHFPEKEHKSDEPEHLSKEVKKQPN